MKKTIAILIPVWFICLNNIRVSLGIETTTFIADDRPIYTTSPSSSAIDVQLMRDRLHYTQSNDIQHTLRNHTLPHYLMHIPKTAGYYAYRILSSTLSDDPKYNKLSPDDKYRLCNVGEMPILKDTILMPAYGGTKCTMYMSEYQYKKLPSNKIPQYAYTIVRNPKHHVLSQYFHCTESNDRGARQKNAKREVPLPNLDEWLSKWVLSIDDSKERFQNSKMRCYNPIDMQSKYVGFDNDYISNNTFTDNNAAADMKSIQQKFTVIGQLDDIDRFLCVVMIHYAGWLPAKCNCSSSDNDQNRRRRLTEISQHGVIHHGSTYNTSRFEDSLIEKLTTKDEFLYDYSKQLFEMQLRVVEEYFNVTICDTIR